MRKLASIQVIQEIKLIPDADRICAYRINNWWIVDQKDKYNIGDMVVYFEIDSWIPNTLAPFLSKDKEPRIFENIKGERLRTIKLKKQVSQGLIMSVEILPADFVYQEGTDVTEVLGILKWELPVPAQLMGQMKDNFPSRISKTDQERAQNLPHIFTDFKDEIFEVTLKLDGSSMTCYILDGEFGVCSRNIDLKETEDNSFWKMARKLDIETKLRKFNADIAIQGELIGEGIQGNPEKIVGQDFKIFDVFNPYDFKYCEPKQRWEILKQLDLDTLHIPVIGQLKLPDTFEELLELAEGPSMNPNTKREGLVFKHKDITFKIIANSYLLKERD